MEALKITRTIEQSVNNMSELQQGDRFAFQDIDGNTHEVEVATVEDDCILVVWTHTLGEDIAWNEDGTTAGGYLNSDIRQYLNEVVYKTLPDWFKETIKQDSNGDYLRLLTKAEVFDGENMLDMFKNHHKRIAQEGYNGKYSDWWWLADVASSAYACFVTHNGYSGSYDASSAFGVRPACLLMR